MFSGSPVCLNIVLFKIIVSIVKNGLPKLYRIALETVENNIFNRTVSKIIFLTGHCKRDSQIYYRIGFSDHSIYIICNNEQ